MAGLGQGVALWRVRRAWWAVCHQHGMEGFGGGGRGVKGSAGAGRIRPHLSPRECAATRLGACVHACKVLRMQCSSMCPRCPWLTAATVAAAARALAQGIAASIQAPHARPGVASKRCGRLGRTRLLPRPRLASPCVQQLQQRAVGLRQAMFQRAAGSHQHLPG